MPLSLSTNDGLALHVHHWPQANPHGTVLIVHGLGEHGGRYATVAAQLNRWGWNVVAHDHRGHGRSGGARGRIDRDDALLLDLGAVIDAVREVHPGRLLLLGHSMGGLIAARFVAEGLQAQPADWFRDVEALVLSSPALAADMSAAQKLALLSLGRLAPDFAVGNGLKPEWVSRDPAVVRAYVADPLVHDRITPRLARFILDGGEFVRSLAARWRVPTLLMWAGSDRCVAPRGSVEFAQGAPKAVVQAQAFAPLYHEIFNEPEQSQVFERLRDWMLRLA
ncbi:alpha/beta hydrolase [uncultured Piscinibacter sp.]|uniref:alpha/beta hydrolase n=1 Tax=uncultured Piscinibacter sp. TaxID=1131835 RepID=UPI00262CD6C2|nr:alpha/beta hydrolase [uncultured Piscinibacter sp.]